MERCKDGKMTERQEDGYEGVPLVHAEAPGLTLVFNGV